MDRREFFNRIIPIAVSLPLIDPAMVRLLGQRGIEKIIEDSKKPTDPVVLRYLEKRGFDKDYVEFSDYTKGRERAKFYTDRISGRKIQVIGSQLMSDSVSGIKFDPQYSLKSDGWELGFNSMAGEVLFSGRVSLTNKNGAGTWLPKVFLDGVEQNVKGSPVLLSVDPVNSHYINNVIEFDYGACKRWLRVIEGEFQERWAFFVNPNKEIRIVHNFSGTGNWYRLGGYAINSDVEVVTKEQFLNWQISSPVPLVEVPFLIDGTLSDEEADGTGGTFGRGFGVTGVNESWSSIRGRNGNYKWTAYLGTNASFVNGSSSPNFKEMARGVYLFDTSSIGAGNQIISAVISLRNWSNAWINGFTDRGFGFTEASRSSPNTMAAYETNKDYTTSASNVRTIGSLALSTYVDWTLNSAGRGLINLIGLSAYCFKSEYDRANITPTYQSVDKRYGTYMCTDSGGVDQKPKITVEYSAPQGKYLLGGGGNPMGYEGVDKVFGK